MRRFRRFRLRPGRLEFSLSGWFRWTVALIVGAYALFRLAELVLLEPLAAVAETEARLRGIDAVNRVIVGSVSRSLQHQDLVTYVKDQQGRIAAYTINTRLINAVAAEAAVAVQQEFRKLSQDEFGVPLGALSGTRLFATQGPAIPVRLMPIGTVAMDIQHEFKGEGINQTRHRIWLQSTARVRVILPIATREVEVTAHLPLSETVIVGPVPSSFFGGKVDGVSVPVQPAP